jgi:hypothetical protein
MNEIKLFSENGHISLRNINQEQFSPEVNRDYWQMDVLASHIFEIPSHLEQILFHNFAFVVHFI